MRFLTRKPDIGTVEGKIGNAILTAEVKRGALTVRGVHQAKIYEELFGGAIESKRAPRVLERKLDGTQRAQLVGLVNR